MEKKEQGTAHVRRYYTEEGAILNRWSVLMEKVMPEQTLMG